MIEIFNSREHEELESILTGGLKSKERLVREGKLTPEQLLHEFERWRQRLIYFDLDEPPIDASWVSILVDPFSTLVGNKVLELDYQSYRMSIMQLYEYLEKQRGNGKFCHPITAERSDKPIRKHCQNSWKKLRGETDHYIGGVYEPEVFIETPLIRDFHRYNSRSN